MSAVKPLRSNQPKLTSGSVCLSCLEHLGWHFLSLLKALLVTKLGGKFRQVPANLASAEVDFWRPQLPQRVMKSHVLTSGGPNCHSESPITTASHQLPQRLIKCAKTKNCRCKEVVFCLSCFVVVCFVVFCVCCVVLCFCCFVCCSAAETTSEGPNYHSES